MADINLGVGGANSAVAGGYEIDNSLKFEPDNSEYFNKTFGSAGNRKTWSYSCWIKKTELFSSNGGALISAYPDVNNRLKIAFSQHKIQVFGKVSGSTTVNVRTNRLYRDTSAFYHILVVFDTTQGTAANRVKIYTNGVLEDSFDQTTYPSQNTDEEVGNSSAHYIGQRGDGSSDFYAGYITEINYVNGQALEPTEFGEFDEDSGIWKPKAYTGSYGTNGFYLDFENSGSLGADSSGNGNNFTLNNITAADQATDTPTNNFATLNPLGENTGSAAITEGATKIDNSGTASWETAYSSIGVTSGKWYAEVTPQLGSFNTNFGIVNFDTAIHDGSTYNNAGYWLGNFDSGSSIYYYFNGSGAGSIVVNVSAGVVIGLALDLDNNTLDFYVNGSQNKQATSLPSGTYGFIADVQGTGGPYIQCNFGGYTVNTISSAASDANGYGTFEYAPPTGYNALCTKNLAEFG